MTILAFQPFSGASGDMLTASLIDLGADASAVQENMEAVADVEVEISEVKKAGIRATRVNVIAEDKPLAYRELAATLRSSGINKTVLADAKAIFDVIADAEATVHGIPKKGIVFHEVGAQDAVADVVGACTAVSLLQADSIFTAPIYIGGGSVNTSHGCLPVPAPVTAEILVKYRLIARGGPVDGELLTPTGAAILAFFTTISDFFLPQMIIERVGYGAGSRDYSHPNVLRATLGQSDESLLRDEVQVLETNVDDVTGEVLGNLVETLLDKGALDVALIPISGKKSRTGHIIQVIVRPSDSHRLARDIIEETGSLGVRVIAPLHRLIAQRRSERVEVRIANQSHILSAKVGTDRHGNVLNIAAEFSEAAELAAKLGIPVKHILRLVEQEAWTRLG